MMVLPLTSFTSLGNGSKKANKMHSVLNICLERSSQVEYLEKWLHLELCHPECWTNMRTWTKQTQGTVNMKNKVESLQGYDLIEANDAVIKLLNDLKELTFKTHEVQYGYWTICQTVRRVLTMRQQDNKPLAEYCKRFTSCVDVAESQWGALVPAAAVKNETDEKTSRDKLITYVFLVGVDTKKYGRLKTELDNAYVAGQDNYPTTEESAMTMLSHYMKDKVVHMTDEDKGQATLTSFMQKHKNVTCYKCGKKGHYANKCPDGDNDDEASIISCLSNRSNNRVGWSG
jgi:hypothetical protein